MNATVTTNTTHGDNEEYKNYKIKITSLKLDSIVLKSRNCGVWTVSRCEVVQGWLGHITLAGSNSSAQANRQLRRGVGLKC